ncbi:hypothetical protein FRC04_007202, partial [Tulasnella sp. 424]
MADLGPLSFEGTSPKECEVFVATIRQRALAQGKHLDNEWIAFLASSYFVGDAFYWYEELDDDVKNDWSRLRPALVARFGRGGSSSTSGSLTSATAPATTIPTPAAAPPALAPRPSVRKGRLKAIDEYGRIRGYITKQFHVFGEYGLTSESPDDALSVSFTVLSVDESFEIQIIDSFQFPQVRDTLAVAWDGRTKDEWVHEGSLRDSLAELFPFSSKSKSQWAIERKVWRISEDAELKVEYPKPDG